ncbi:MAG: MBOAT family protein [Clostridiales Family XIII bacterium]|jgi:alginate O-acetyltransferase complex protein AlgI|nr:MBOAT family protein [Clostridiales Family XIII bacterium]
MLFSSVTFLYYFLPIVLVGYFLTPMPGGSARFRNAALLVCSLFFYAWGEPLYVLLMLFQSLAGWFFGLLIDGFRGSPAGRIALAASVTVGVGGLALFKYSDFFSESLGALFRTSVPSLGLALPIGISFYTFQILSYTIDLYRGKIRVQRNPLTFSTYVTLFPQLIAGPIVRYADLADTLARRTHSIERFAAGVRRFVTGLAKKVLLANTLGELAAACGAADEQSVLLAWLYALAYSLHIYFDFSGYSDMAIGLGHMFGFKFPENFNYPYIARSVTEFWRRWHMSLSAWFRDYVYIPLGGNRAPTRRRVLNILLVWLLTGFWHGAGWTFVLWGLYFGLLLLLEKYALAGFLDRLPAFFGHVYLLLCVILGWVLFDAPDPGAAARTAAALFGLGATGFAGAKALYYLRGYALPLLIASVFCTPLPARIARALSRGESGARRMTALEPLCVLLILALATAFLVDGSYNPFIYFRF